MNDIPTERDWRTERWSEHTPDAYRAFFSKSREDAVRLFGNDAQTRYNELCSMPVGCFSYYVHSYIDYLVSDRSKGDSAGGAYFLCLVDERLTDIMKFDTVVINAFVDVLGYLNDNQSWFETDNELYFGTVSRIKRLKRFLISLGADHGG